MALENSSNLNNIFRGSSSKIPLAYCENKDIFITQLQLIASPLADESIIYGGDAPLSKETYQKQLQETITVLEKKSHYQSAGRTTFEQPEVGSACLNLNLPEVPIGFLMSTSPCSANEVPKNIKEDSHFKVPTKMRQSPTTNGFSQLIQRSSLRAFCSSMKPLERFIYKRETGCDVMTADPLRFFPSSSYFSGVGVGTPGEDRHRLGARDDDYEAAGAVEVCVECQKVFKRKVYLQRHMEREHWLPAKVFKCDDCKYETKHQSNLSVHRRTHTGERPYHCGACGQRYTQGHLLKSHIRSRHAGNMRFYNLDKRSESTRGRKSLDFKRDASFFDLCRAKNDGSKAGRLEDDLYKYHRSIGSSLQGISFYGSRSRCHLQHSSFSSYLPSDLDLFVDLPPPRSIRNWSELTPSPIDDDPALQLTRWLTGSRPDLNGIANRKRTAVDRRNGMPFLLPSIWNRSMTSLSSSDVVMPKLQPVFRQLQLLDDDYKSSPIIEEKPAVSSGTMKMRHRRAPAATVLDLSQDRSVNVGLLRRSSTEDRNNRTSEEGKPEAEVFAEDLRMNKRSDETSKFRSEILCSVAVGSLPKNDQHFPVTVGFGAGGNESRTAKSPEPTTVHMHPSRPCVNDEGPEMDACPLILSSAPSLEEGDPPFKKRHAHSTLISSSQHQPSCCCSPPKAANTVVDSRRETSKSATRSPSASPDLPTDLSTTSRSTSPVSGEYPVTRSSDFRNNPIASIRNQESDGDTCSVSVKLSFEGRSEEPNRKSPKTADEVTLLERKNSSSSMTVDGVATCCPHFKKLQEFRKIVFRLVNAFAPDLGIEEPEKYAETDLIDDIVHAAMFNNDVEEETVVNY